MLLLLQDTRHTKRKRHISNIIESYIVTLSSQRANACAKRICRSILTCEGQDAKRRVTPTGEGCPEKVFTTILMHSTYKRVRVPCPPPDKKQKVVMIVDIIKDGRYYTKVVCPTTSSMTGPQLLRAIMKRVTEKIPSILEANQSGRGNRYQIEIPKTKMVFEVISERDMT